MAYINRLKKLEKEQTTEFNELLQLIRQGVFYDDLTDQNKELYCQYHGIDREAMEETELLVVGSLRFQLQEKRPPADQKTHEKIIEEVSAYMKEP